MVAVETIHGFPKVHVSHQKNVGNTTLFGSEKITKKTRKTQNVFSVNMITGYANVILPKRKI